MAPVLTLPISGRLEHFREINDRLQRTGEWSAENLGHLPKVVGIMYMSWSKAEESTAPALL